MKRAALSHILESVAEFPATIISGPRQVGKTTLAREIARQHDSVFLDLERPSDAARLREPELFLSAQSGRMVVLDEVQRAPGLFPLLRSLIDDERRPGRFLLLGSASPELLGLSAESLAGRAQVVELGPFALGEVRAGFAELPGFWLRGGFPLSFLARNDAASYRWRNAFVRHFLERDIPQLGIRIAADNLRRFWTMLSHLHGQIWNASQLAASFGVSAPTMQHYLGILTDTRVIRSLSPYLPNLGKRLVKSPRIYVRDSGLLHALLGIPTLDALQGHPVLGSSWEGWVIEQIALMTGDDARLSFYRTAVGAEIDCIVETGNRRIAVEVKFSSAPRLSRGFWQALEDVAPDCCYVVAPVRESYPLGKGVQAWPAHRLAEVLA